MSTILVVDDEPHIVELASLYLRNDGFATLSAPDGLKALEMIREHRPDLVVLDIMLPRLDGWEVCRQLRQKGDSVPIIMLTARSEHVDRIVGLELGADDYLTKPFNPRELVARVKAVLRRVAGAVPPHRVLRLGQLELDPERREAQVGGSRLHLRTKEFDLLAALAERPGYVFSRDQLLEHVWGYTFGGGTRTVDVHVARLRDKIEGSGVHIETVWNVGYKLIEG
jgi:DNA-binding response OmpR family regulator